MKYSSRKTPLAILIYFLLACGHAVNADYASNQLAEDEVLIRQIKDLQATIGQLEKTEGPYSLKLYKPVRDLALLQKNTGNLSAALDAFHRVQHLVHRAYGVYDERQMESIDQIIETYYLQGKAAEIDRQQHFRFLIAEKTFEPHSEPMLYARLRLADWYRGSGQLDKASSMYEEMYQELLDIEDVDPNLKVRMLRADALTQYLAGKCCASESLHEALRLMESDEISNVEPSQAIVDYMDMAFMERREVGVIRADLSPAFLGFSRPKHVIELMAMSNTRNPRGETYVDFGERKRNDAPVPTIGYPVAMCGNTYDALVSDDSNPEFSVSVELDDAGRPHSISVDGDGPIRLKRYLKNSLQTGRYRPATTESGEFTAATLSFRQTFGATDTRAGSLSSVTDWSKLLVAQTCQISGLQRI